MNFSSPQGRGPGVRNGRSHLHGHRILAAVNASGWPWGVWTDGRKFAVVATHGSAVLIWNSIPARDNLPPDLILRPRDAGTPRNITSDGTFFAVSDHNNGERSRPATMVWRTFPTSADQPPDFSWGEWLKGTFTQDHKLVLAGMRAVFIWNQLPQDIETDANVALYPPSYRNGDGPDVAIAGGRFYVCNYNGNNVLAWNSIPARDDQTPDFALGSDSPEQDTWAENFFITNPVVATDGQSLFISSDFDETFRLAPIAQRECREAGPDVLVARRPVGQCAAWADAGARREAHGVCLAQAPARRRAAGPHVERRIGSVRLQDLTGVALDDKYFYLAVGRPNPSTFGREFHPARASEIHALDAKSAGSPVTAQYLARRVRRASHRRLARTNWSDAVPTRGRTGQFNLPVKGWRPKGISSSPTAAIIASTSAPDCRRIEWQAR